MDNAEPSANLDPIAIIGMSGRFPGAKDIHAFWRNLRDGIESISTFTEQELLASGEQPATLRDPNYVRYGAILDDADRFDADFFGFHARDAELMNPQQRVFLEATWEALEDAGYDSKAYPGRIGVYAGARTNRYLWSNIYSNAELMRLGLGKQAIIGNWNDFLCTRVSYILHLKGPSLTVQTACSTSLVAVHLACSSLLNGECEMALAGGVSINVPQKLGYLYQEGGILSPDGRCRTFDARAQGCVAGNGVGVVVLKRLEQAIADGDYVYAIIAGSAINNDGALKAGYTAPSIDGQMEVISEALAMAGVAAETIGYVEAHGTATPLGDPIEVAALTQSFRASTDKKAFCMIGSVKTNIGHLDAAAGIAGLIKAVLALTHRQLPPSLHFHTPNPNIDFANSPFSVNATLREWKTAGRPRRAGVSSFGIGGTNAHVVLEEAPPVESPPSARPWQLLVLSAKTRSALDAATANLAQHFKQHPDINLADVAYTLQVGRRPFEHRRMVVCHDLAGAAHALETQDADQVLTRFQQAGTRSVAFLFSGQGAQYPNMALELYRTEPVFRKQIDRCAELLVPQLGLDLREILADDRRPTTGDQRPATNDEDPDAVTRRPGAPPLTPRPESASDQLIHQTRYTQPALFAVEYALAKLWMSWGVRPQALIGHSIGEYVAACLAGIFSLEDALALVAARGRLMQQLPSGAMIAVALPERELQPLLGQHLSLAAVNGPAHCVVSGPADAIADLERQFGRRGMSARRLRTSHAFHSAMVEPIIQPFIEQLRRVDLKPPKIPLISNVTGTWMSPAEAQDPSYWSRHLRQTVRFAEGLGELLKRTGQVLLEVGPGRTLWTFAQQHPSKTDEHDVIASLRHPQDRLSDAACVLDALGRLWLAGIPIDWARFYAHERRRRQPLPTYPFERARYWVERTAPAASAPPPAEHAALHASETSDGVAAQAAADSPGAAEYLTTDSAVERVIEQQLEVMSQQLYLLRAQ